MKRVLSFILVFFILTGITAFASEGYVYTNDGRLYSLKKEAFEADNVKEACYSSAQLYILKNDNTLWVKQGKDELFYITDNVKQFKVQSNTYTIIKFDNTLLMGEFAWSDMKFVMDNVKEVVTTGNVTMCLTNDNELYTWGLKGFMGLGEVKKEEEACARIDTPTLVMENVENIWEHSGRHFASKTDGSFWAWGSNKTYYKPAGMGMGSLEIRNLLGLGDGYKDVAVQCEPVRMAVDNVKELYFNDLYHTVAVTKNGDLYYWGSNAPWGAIAKPATSLPVKTHENVREIVGRSVILNDGRLCWAFWDDGVVCDNVKDAEGSILLTNNGEVYKWRYDYFMKEPEAEFALVAENVREFCDANTDDKVLCICDDTTLIEIDTDKGEKVSLAANVYDAFYYENKVYFIDNAYTLYTVKDGGIKKLLDNAVLEIKPISVNINGEKLVLDADPYIKNERTLVPMRAIFEALGATVTWDDETKTAIGVKGSLEVKITIGENVLYKGSEKVELDAVAEITNDRTMVPVRAISEAFEYIVEWDNETRTVNIIEPSRRIYYTYDENGQVTLTESADGNVIIRYEYLHDEIGNVVRVWEKEMIKNSDRLYEYTYNEKGQMVSKGVCSDWWMDALYGGPIDKEVTFTEVEKYYYEDDKLIYAEYPSGGKRYYIYDEEGKLIREENDKGKVVTKYVYDENGVLEYKEEY